MLGKLFEPAAGLVLEKKIGITLFQGTHHNLFPGFGKEDPIVSGYRETSRTYGFFNPTLN